MLRLDDAYTGEVNVRISTTAVTTTTTTTTTTTLFPMTKQPLVGQGLFSIEASLSLSDTPLD